MTGYTKERRKIGKKRKSFTRTTICSSVSPYSTFFVCHYLTAVQSCSFSSVNTTLKKGLKKSRLFMHLMDVSEITKQIKRMEFSHCINFFNLLASDLRAHAFKNCRNTF